MRPGYIGPEPGVVKVFETLTVKFVSLADVPADQESAFLIVKNASGGQAAEEGQEVFAFEAPVVKTLVEERYVLGIVATPDKVDGHGDMIPASVIRAAAHDFMARWRRLDDMHQMLPVGVPVESIVAPNDITIGDTKVRAGSWLLGIKVTDDAAWNAIKNGQRKGFSILGDARKRRVPVEPVRKTADSPTVMPEGRDAPPADATPESTDMEPAQIEELVKKTLTAILGPLIEEKLEPVRKQLKTVETTANGAAQLAAVEEVKKTLGAVEKEVKDITGFLDEPVRKALAQAKTPPPAPGSFMAQVKADAPKP